MIQAKKSLGQNFLKSEKALSDIISAGEISSDDTVLEIGPGEGVLTKKLLEKAGKVIAIEKDDRLIPILEQKFSSEISSDKLKLIHADILSFDFSASKLLASGYTLVANIPYYITGEIFRMFLEELPQPKKMVLLVQKEVAERIIARDDKESILSMSVKVYGTPKYISTVLAGSFVPAPNVDSAILAISDISKKNFTESNLHLSASIPRPSASLEKKFFKILRTGFAHKRKLLSGNLKPLSRPGLDIEEIMKNSNIPAKARAENLKTEQWIALAKQITL